MAAFDNPAYRASLSPAQYERERQAHFQASTFETVAGHGLRYVQSPFGRLVHVGMTGIAFRTVEAARDYAAANPA